MRLVCVVAAAGAAAGCLSTPPPTVCPDRDHDGWPIDCPGAAYLDCDDGDPARHPGAREKADGIADLDCDRNPLAAASDFPDLGLTVFGDQGARLTTRVGEVTLDPFAGHQLRSLTLNLADHRTTDNVIYDGAGLNERDSGVHLWDSYWSTRPTTSSAVVNASGPALYQSLVTWSQNSPSGGVAMNGTSLYTVTLDGRIHRTDHFKLSQGPYDGAGFHVVTSFVALDTSSGGFTDVVGHHAGTTTAESVSITSPNPLFANGSPDGHEWVCARSPQHEIGWAAVVSRDGQPAGGLRASSNNADGVAHGQVALQYDWVPPPGNTVPLGDYTGSFLITPGPYSSDLCQLAGERARAFTDPAEVSPVAPATTITNVDGDVDSDGFVEAGGYWALDAHQTTGVELSLTQAAGEPIPAYATFRIRGLPAHVDPVVLRDGVRLQQGERYRIQPDGEDGIWLVILFGLAPGVSIELVYPPCNPCPS